MSIGTASLVAISTLTSEINFYTRLIQMIDPATSRPLFTTRCIELCCEKCKEEGKSHECVHMLHLVPSWQSEERHRKLKIMVKPSTSTTPVTRFHFASLASRSRFPRLPSFFDFFFFALIVLLAMNHLSSCFGIPLFAMHSRCNLTLFLKYRCKTAPTSYNRSWRALPSTRCNKCSARETSCWRLTAQVCRLSRTK